MTHKQLQEQRIHHHLREHRKVLDDLERQLGSRIIAAAELLTEVLRGGGKIMIMGNGGSAADAQHFAAELGRTAPPTFAGLPEAVEFILERPCGYRQSEGGV